MTDCVDNSAVLPDKMVNSEDLDNPDKVELESIIEAQKPSLEPPLRDSAPTSVILGSPSKTRPASVVSIKNTRKRMEDRHVVLHDLKAYIPSSLQSKIDSDEHVSYYAVFDGHAGTDAATYAAAHLHEMLVDSPNYPDNPEAAFTDAFLMCDEKFVSTSKKSGTTAVCCLVKDDKIFVSWLGDSQALLVRDGQPIRIVDPHKPNRDDEKERIEKLGGTIMYWGTWRVNGQLAVSRAIGDGEYKPYISAQSDVTTITMNGTEYYIIIACDGLWDMVSFEEATELTNQYLSDPKNDVENLSVYLSNAAKDKGSSDNITIIVLFLKPIDEIRNRSTDKAQHRDSSGITSSSQFVFVGGGGRESIDQMRVPSPGINFTSPDGGGGMFCPFSQQGAQNGFDFSNENFDTRLSDEQKRFSDEQKRLSEENVTNMDNLMKEKAIDKVNDLLAVLNCGDSSPTPEDDEGRPLEEILATARERTEDVIDGVDNGDSSDDDSEEEVELRRKPSTDALQFTVTSDPVIDPCEQVTVVATGPDECGTVVPPSEEMPVHQQPESVELAPSPGLMSCSMVKEENGVQDGVSFDVNGETSLGETGFMLKTPGEGEEQLSEFSPNKESRKNGEDSKEISSSTEDVGEVSKEISSSTENVINEHTETISDDFDNPEVIVETPEVIVSSMAEMSTVDVAIDSVGEKSDLADITVDHQSSSSQDSSSGLDVPSLQVTPATPVRSLTPVDTNMSTSSDTEVENEPAEQLDSLGSKMNNFDHTNCQDVDMTEIPPSVSIVPDTEKSEADTLPTITTTLDNQMSEKPSRNDNTSVSDKKESENSAADKKRMTEPDAACNNEHSAASASVPTITTTAPTPKKPASNNEEEGPDNGVMKEKETAHTEERNLEEVLTDTVSDKDDVEKKDITPEIAGVDEKSDIPTNGINEMEKPAVPTTTTSPASPTSKKSLSIKDTKMKPNSSEIPMKSKSAATSKRSTTTRTPGILQDNKPHTNGGISRSTASTKTGNIKTDVTKKAAGTKLNGATAGLVKRTAATRTADEKSQSEPSKNPPRRAPLQKSIAGSKEKPKVSDKTTSMTTTSIPTSTVGRGTSGVLKAASSKPTVARTTSNVSSTAGSKRPAMSSRPTVASSTRTTATGSSKPATSGSSTRPMGVASTGPPKEGGTSRPSSGSGSKPNTSKTSVGTMSKTVSSSKITTTTSKTSTRPSTIKQSTSTTAGTRTTVSSTTTGTRSTAATSSRIGSKSISTSTIAGSRTSATSTTAGSRATSTSTTASKPTSAASRVAAARAAAKENSKQGKKVGKVESKEKIETEVKNIVDTVNYNNEQDKNETLQTVACDLLANNKDSEIESNEPSATADEVPSGSSEETNNGDVTCALEEKESEC